MEVLCTLTTEQCIPPASSLCVPLSARAHVCGEVGTGFSRGGTGQVKEALGGQLEALLWPDSQAEAVSESLQPPGISFPI